MKVIHLTTWKEVCGIATYSQNLINSLESNGIYNEVYPINRTELEYFSLDEIRNHFAEFCKVAKDYDIVHIQHEHGFFHGSYSFDKAIDIFHEILVTLKKNKKKVIVTFHTEPIFTLPVYKVLSNGLSHVSKNIAKLVQTLKWKLKIAPMFSGSKNAFTAIVHTKKSRLSFINSGFDSKSIKVVKHGITTRSKSRHLGLYQNQYKSKINLDENSKLISIFGFVSSYKGYEIAIKALKHLPNKYCLAIIGGGHPNARTDTTIDKILDLITKLDLRDKVTITGFIDFESLELFHAATDICLAPYLPSTLSASGALTWALNSGKPVIASKIPAFYELNQEANCMLMFTPECPNELAWQILNLERDEQLQKQLVENSLKYAKENSWENVGSIICKLYKELIFKTLE